MEKKNAKKISSIATGTLVLGSLGLMANSANAADLTSYNDLGSGSELRSNLLNETNPIIPGAITTGIELKCGNDKAADHKCGEKAKTKDASGEKTKEANCGEKTKDAKSDAKMKDAKCGEKTKDHSCGEKMKEGSCGESDKKADPKH